MDDYIDELTSIDDISTELIEDMDSSDLDFFEMDDEITESIDIEENLDDISEELATEIEEITSLDVAEDRALLLQLDNLSDEELYDFYDKMETQRVEREQFDEITQNLGVDDLKKLREQVISEDQETLDVFAIKDNSEESGYQKIKRYPF